MTSRGEISRRILCLVEPTQDRAESQACLSYPERQRGRRSQSAKSAEMFIRFAHKLGHTESTENTEILSPDGEILGHTDYTDYTDFFANR
jgi:hypothetical protein